MISSLQKEGFFIKHNSSKRLHLESALEAVRYFKKKINFISGNRAYPAPESLSKVESLAIKNCPKTIVAND